MQRGYPRIAQTNRSESPQEGAVIARRSPPAPTTSMPPSCVVTPGSAPMASTHRRDVDDRPDQPM